MDGETTYNVGFTFKAVPYLQPGRNLAALSYIRQLNLVPPETTPSLAPLEPESSRLFLTLPKPGGGIEVTERPEADVVFTDHILDSLNLPANAFAEIFQSMRGAGETLNGTVQVKLPGRTEEQTVAFAGDLNRMRGTIVEATLVGPGDNAGATYRVRVANVIESPVELQEVVVRLLADPDTQSWVGCTVEGGVLPLRLASGEQKEISVRPPNPVSEAWSARLELLQSRVDLNFESLWLSVLETPGWDDITHEVTVKVAPMSFDGPNAPEEVHVIFNQEEASAVLKQDAPAKTVKLVKPFLLYLLTKEEADDYFYRVESWRAGTVLASSSILRSDERELQVTPP
jgi:hypothetical protein